jgi:hypothetical protein
MTPIDPKRIELLDPMVARILRTKTPAEKMRQMADANRFVRTALSQRIAAAHLLWNEHEVSAEVGRRMLHESDEVQQLGEEWRRKYHASLRSQNVGIPTGD